jgi:hypothetical protein
VSERHDPGTEDSEPANSAESAPQLTSTPSFSGRSKAHLDPSYWRTHTRRPLVKPAFDADEYVLRLDRFEAMLAQTALLYASQSTGPDDQFLSRIGWTRDEIRALTAQIADFIRGVGYPEPD